ncbi:MAG: hypothetical protein EOM20_06615 [Spartobacteria bacterium]|nr:hypothetical protein [Spartobacteria bacterium]
MPHAPFRCQVKRGIIHSDIPLELASGFRKDEPLVEHLTPDNLYMTHRKQPKPISACIQRSVLLLALVLRVVTLQAGVLEIDDGLYKQTEDARKAWQAKEGSPPVVVKNPGARGLIFECPFTTDRDRVYWDKDVRLDLSGYSSFDIELSCSNPGAIRALRIYFKSGDGWYVWGGAIREAGRQTLKLLKSEFSTEGTPRGWHAIERIRFSPWKGVPASTSIILYNMRAQQDGVALIQGTLSAGPPAERKAAERATRRVSNWLKEAGISHHILTDEDVSRQTLEHVRIAVLCYNPTLPLRERAVLEKFMRRGGRLVVFYSSDAALAKLMHMKLGPYKAADKAGQWSSFLFQRPGEWFVPHRIYQDSWNIRPVQPADRTAQVIATWLDAEGQRTADPAWVASEQGLWMSHILLNDDARNKQDMLVGLLGKLDSTLWPDMAWHALQRAGKIDSFRTMGEAVSAITLEAEQTGTLKVVAPLLEQAQRLFRNMLHAYDRRRYPQVIESARELRDILIRAYALTQNSRHGEFRGIWDHEGTGWYPGDWERTARLLKKQGFNAVFPNVAWGGVAHYAGRALPRSNTVRLYGDQLSLCTEACRNNGLQVHAWKICWNLDGAPEDFIARMKKENRLQVAPDNHVRTWLCPSHAANRELERAAIREMAERYEVDGIHLDYIRYPEGPPCCCAACRAQFEQNTHQRVGRWPRDILQGGSLYDAFMAWRARQLTAFVRDVKNDLRKVRPEVKLSAAVFGKYPSCKTAVGQDWATWLAEGTVDFVCPMNYTTDAATFSSLTHQQLALPGSRGRVYPGLGVTAAESQLTPDLVIEQIRILRKLGADGFLLFDLNPTLREETLPILKLGITR